MTMVQKQKLRQTEVMPTRNPRALNALERVLLKIRHFRRLRSQGVTIRLSAEEATALDNALQAMSSVRNPRDMPKLSTKGQNRFFYVRDLATADTMSATPGAKFNREAAKFGVRQGKILRHAFNAVPDSDARR
jgi:hypothetical protein